MEPTLFERTLEPLGYFKRANKGNSPIDPEAYEDLVFVPVNQQPICPLCGQGHHLTWERKFYTRNTTFWRIKCLHCKQGWNEKGLKLDLEQIWENKAL